MRHTEISRNLRADGCSIGHLLPSYRCFYVPIFLFSVQIEFAQLLSRLIKYLLAGLVSKPKVVASGTFLEKDFCGGATLAQFLMRIIAFSQCFYLPHSSPKLCSHVMKRAVL